MATVQKPSSISKSIRCKFTCTLKPQSNGAPNSNTEAEDELMQIDSSAAAIEPPKQEIKEGKYMPQENMVLA